MASILALAMCLTLLPGVALAAPEAPSLTNVQVKFTGITEDAGGGKWANAEISWDALSDTSGDIDFFPYLLDSATNKGIMLDGDSTTGFFTRELKNAQTENGRSKMSVQIRVLNQGDEQVTEYSNGNKGANGLKEGDTALVQVYVFQNGQESKGVNVEVLFTEENVRNKKTFTGEEIVAVEEEYSATVKCVKSDDASAAPAGVEASATVTWKKSEGATKAYAPVQVPGYSVSPASATLNNGDTVTFTYTKLDMVTVNGGYTLTVNYLIPVGPKYGNLKVASKTEIHQQGEHYSVPSPNYMDLTPSVNPVEGNMPGSNLTVDVVYSPLYNATVNYVLASGATAPASGLFKSIDRTEGLKNGEAYYFPVPSYDGLTADRTEVEGNIAGANAQETVTYKKDDFTVIVKYQSGGNVSSDNLVSFMEQAGGYAKSGYRNGQFYSVPSPSYYGVRPLEDKVEGYIEWADVEKVVYYTDACTNPGGHNWTVTHEGNTHKEKCQFCGIEKAPQTTEVTYLPLGENKHSVQCGVCGADLREEACSASVENNAVGNTACSGKCQNCGGTFEYGNEHDFSGQKWTASAGGGTHEKVCNRCGHVERETCNATGWAHQGSGAGAQHATACSICGGNVGAWQACSYTKTKISGGRHTALCQCGRSNGTENCHYVLESTTASTHTYRCTGCNGTASGNHNRKTCKENETPATKYAYAGYTLVTYCGRCNYEISRRQVGGSAKKLPLTKLTKQYTKKHFNFGGGGGFRPGERHGSRGGGGGGAAAYVNGNNVVQQQPLVNPLLANIVSDGLYEYVLDNYDTLLLPAEDALEAYFAAHPNNMGEGWSIDLEPSLTLTMTGYDEATQTLTVDISATYSVHLTNGDGGIDVLIGQNYPLAVNSAIDLEFDIPDALAAQGQTLYVRHNHGGIYYYYNAAVNADGDLATASFTASAGLSTFELRTTAWPQNNNNNNNNNSPVNGGEVVIREDRDTTASTGTTTAKTESKTDARGNKTETTTTTTTTKNADGSTTEKTTETAKTTATDGSKTESKAETSVTTKANADGGTTTTEKATETAVTTAADGKKTTVETNAESTETLDRSGNGTIEGTKTETVKDASGKVTETTVTESKGTVATAADGTKTTLLENKATTTDAEGNVTTTVTKEKAIDAADGSRGSTIADESGKTISASATVSEKAVSDAARVGNAVTLPVEVKAANNAVDAAPVEVTLPGTVSKEKPATVEIPVENLTPGTVAVLVKADGTEEIVKTSTNGESGVALTLDGSATVKIVDNTKSFDDVSGSEWYAGDVAWASSREVMNGVGNGSFDPDAATTQGMMEQILYNIDGNDLAAPAEGETWWTAADSWADGEAVTAGLGDAHDPAAPATREVDVLMLYNYAKSKGYDTSARADLSRFSDADSVSAAAREAMSWAVAVGLINGAKDADGNVTLDAQGVATRGQIAAITQRFCEKVAK